MALKKSTATRKTTAKKRKTVKRKTSKKRVIVKAVGTATGKSKAEKSITTISQEIRDMLKSAKHIILISE
jgi:hypothetical protein